MKQTKFKTLTYCGYYVDVNQLGKGIYCSSKPYLYNMDDTIETLIKRAETIRDMSGQNFISDSYFINLNQCQMTEILITTEIENNFFVDKEITDGSLIEEEIEMKPSYWESGKWVQPPAIIQHGDLVNVKCDGILGEVLGRYIGKGYGVVKLEDYSSGVKYVIGKVQSRGLNKNPELVSDEKLLEFIKD